MNDEASRIYGYTFISNANSKFFQQKFTLSRDFQVCISDMAMLFQTV